jgi:FO synthase
MSRGISRAAGAVPGQEPPARADEAAIRAIGRTPRQRTTLYGEPPGERVAASFGAAPLSEPLNPQASEAGLEAATPSCPPRVGRSGPSHQVQWASPS